MTDFDVDTILEDTHTRLAGEYVAAFQDYLVAVVLKNAPQTRDARLRLEEVVRESMGRAEVLGAFSTLRQASGVISDEARFNAFRREQEGQLPLPWPPPPEWQRLTRFADTAATKILSRVTFAEALEDLVDRTPVTLHPAAERTAKRVAELYSEDRGVIAFAKSAEDAVTQRAQELIASAMREGIQERDIGRTLAFDVNRIRKDTEAWTESYARMAFRTNLNDANSNGRLLQAQDPDVKIVIPALMYTAVGGKSGDGDTRPNHRAAHGVILSVDNPAWRFMRPPFGYN